MNKFFNTAIGSYLKVFITTILAVYMAELSAGHDMFSMDYVMLKKLLGAGIASVLPVIYNALNPNDPRYGKADSPSNFAPEKTNKIVD